MVANSLVDAARYTVEAAGHGIELSVKSFLALRLSIPNHQPGAGWVCRLRI